MTNLGEFISKRLSIRAQELAGLMETMPEDTQSKLLAYFEDTDLALYLMLVYNLGVGRDRSLDAGLGGNAMELTGIERKLLLR